MFPATIATLAGTVSSLFGKKPSYTPDQQLQQQIARQLYGYSQGVPGAAPDEMAALAQSRALLGNEQNQATQQVLASLPRNATTNVADLMANLTSRQASERGALDLNALMKAYAEKRAALLQAAQVAGSVGPKGEPGSQSNLPELFGQLAYQQALAKASKAGQAANRREAEAGLARTGSGALHPGYNPTPEVPTLLPPTSPKPAFGGQSTAEPILFGGAHEDLTNFGVSPSQQRDYLYNNFPSAFHAGALAQGGPISPAMNYDISHFTAPGQGPLSTKLRRQAGY